MKLNKLYNTDCIGSEGMIDKVVGGHVDLILTSPPYDNVYGAGYSGKKKDPLFMKLYSEFLDKFFRQIYEILSPHGSFFLNLKSRIHNKCLQTPHWIEFLESFQQFKLKSYIIWKYSGSFDSSNIRHHLDYEIFYHFSKTDRIYLDTDCGIHDPLTSVWQIPHHISNRLHPTQMPEAVAERVIKVASRKYDVVFDPFAGSGTTLAVAKRLNRNYIGFELDPEYCEIAKRRIKEVRSGS